MRIEYEDRDLIVVYKEAGLPVQTGRVAQKDLVSLLKNHLWEEAEKTPPKETQQVAEGRAFDKKAPYLGIVHRLDQPVEGLLVFAKTPKAAANLSSQAAGRKMQKEYRALVQLDGSSFPLALEARKHTVTLEDWLLRDFSANKTLIAEEGARGAKRAELEFETLEIKDSQAYVRILLHTGRHHQIRVQMAHAGMPLVGDRKYGELLNNRMNAVFSSDGTDAALSAQDMGHSPGPLCLCAAGLSFLHPNGSGRKHFQVEPQFATLLKRC